MFSYWLLLSLTIFLTSTINYIQALYNYKDIEIRKQLNVIETVNYLLSISLEMLLTYLVTLINANVYIIIVLMSVVAALTLFIVTAISSKLLDNLLIKLHNKLLKGKED